MEESRRLLESHLNEFFSPTTSNDRKRQIEVVLETFSKQNGSWKQALYFLSHSSANQYVTMFCLSVIETTIKCKWLVMSEGERNELKSTIYSFLLQHATPSSVVKCPGFVRNKIVKLLVDVGKFSWPQSYPDFFSNILQITANEETVGIGLMFIKTVSEEYPNCKDEISTERKAELKMLLLQQMPNVFEVLRQILLSGLTRYSACPSPEVAGQSPQSENSVVTHFDEVLSLALETISNLLTWIPLDGYRTTSQSQEQYRGERAVPFPEHFVRLICQYAHVDTCPHFRTKGSQLGILAMGTLNELLYRKFIPKEFDMHIDTVTSFAIEVLKRVSNRSTIVTLPQQYLEKVIEFLCLVASHHFFRYHGPCSKNFVTFLLSFTFEQSETVYYYECLEIWARLLDHLNAGVPFVFITMNREDLIEYFKQPMLDLATKIVLSTQKFDIETDDTFETDEEEGETEAPSLSRNIDILVKIGELLPSESLEVVTSLWAESCVYYGGLAACLDPSKTNITIENDANIKHFIFIIQLMGRLASVFYGQRLYENAFKKQIEVGKSILHELIKVLLCSKEYYFVKYPSSIIQANCEIICSLKTWIYWLARYHSEVIQTDASEPEVQSFYEMINVCTEFVFFTLENRTVVDHSIVLAQANFFNTLVNTLRTQYIFKMQCVRNLIEKLHTLGTSLDPETYRVLHKVSATLILLPWQNVSNQEWEVRSKIYVDFMKNMSNDLFESANRPNVLVFWVRVLNDQLDMLMSESTNSKRICWNIYKELVPFTRAMVTQHLKEPMVNEELLNFFIKVMEVLRQQVGAQFFEETIRLFLQLFSRGNLVQELMKESDTIVVEKFLNLLQFMVKDNSSSFKKFFGEALTLCYNNIYPHLAQRPTPELKIPFFQFIRDCVNYRWNYFFPSSLTVRSAILSGISSQSPEQASEAASRLNDILQSIGHSFLQADLEIFRFNLATLSSWNDKHKLYQRLSDRQEYLDQFMTLFIQILIQKSHDLLREEIATVLFEMASVNYERFSKGFLPQTIAINFPQLTVEHRTVLLDKFSIKASPENCGSPQASSSSALCDLPTFTQNLNKFIDDIRYFHFCIECSAVQVQPNNVAVVKPQQQC